MKDDPRLAKASVHDTLASYVWCADFGDLDALVALFSEDAPFEMKGRTPVVGRQALRRAFVEGFGISPAQRESQRAAGPIRHHLSSVRVALDGDARARAWSYFAAISPAGLDHWGRYTDQLCLEQDRWIFASRRVSVDGCHPGSAFSVYRQLSPAAL